MIPGIAHEAVDQGAAPFRATLDRAEFRTELEQVCLDQALLLVSN